MEIQKIKMFQIKVNEGRREIRAEAVHELADSISKVGLLNPIMIDKDYNLIAGLHRLEAAKLLGWAEIKCTVSGLEGLMAELAEIDENFVRKGLSDIERGDLLLRRKEIYEALHPETRHGMRNGQTSKDCKLQSLETKAFIQETADQLGVNKSTIARQIQTAKNLTPEAKDIIRAAGVKVTKTNALKLSRLSPEQQKEAAAQLVSGAIQTVDEYHSASVEPKPAEKQGPKLPEPPPEGPTPSAPGTRRFMTFAENAADLKDPNKDCSCTPDTFVAEFSAYVQKFIRGIKWYITPDYSVVFPALSRNQMSYLRELIISVGDTVDTIFHQIEGCTKE